MVVLLLLTRLMLQVQYWGTWPSAGGIRLGGINRLEDLILQKVHNGWYQYYISNIPQLVVCGRGGRYIVFEAVSSDTEIIIIFLLMMYVLGIAAAAGLIFLLSTQVLTNI